MVESDQPAARSRSIFLKISAGFLEWYYGYAGSVDEVVLDPTPRGCGREVLDALAKIQAPWLVYVSCDPGTMTRFMLASNKKWIKPEGRSTGGHVCLEGAR
jgi:tRNA/tmRNA/rRNA uracil-C5-methylase (TrmA/RlmC/RlmD family)